MEYKYKSQNESLKWWVRNIQGMDQHFLGGNSEHVFQILSVLLIS